jgi:hypothetical protein
MQQTILLYGIPFFRSSFVLFCWRGLVVEGVYLEYLKVKPFSVRTHRALFCLVLIQCGYIRETPPTNKHATTE